MTKEEKLLMFAEVQKELKAEFDVDLSVEEIANIFVSQFKIMAYGFVKGIATTIPFFGKFLPIDRDFYKEHFILPNRKEQVKLIAQGEIDKAHEIYIESLEAVAKHKKEALRIPPLSADQVLGYNKHIEVPDALDITKNMK